ncbi:MAG: hypothetical protein WBC75_09390 [Dehalococcoidales bacterium]
MRNAQELISALGPWHQDWGLVPDDREKWQDVIQAMHGVGREKVAFLFYVYGGRKEYRHELFAGLFIEVMQNQKILAWREAGKVGAVEKLCELAILEWGDSETRVTNLIRAAFLNISVSSWQRHYRDTYTVIYETPVAWEREVMDLVTKRLR